MLFRKKIWVILSLVFLAFFFTFCSFFVSVCVSVCVSVFVGIFVPDLFYLGLSKRSLGLDIFGCFRSLVNGYKWTLKAICIISTIRERDPSLSTSYSSLFSLTSFSFLFLFPLSLSSRVGVGDVSFEVTSCCAEELTLHASEGLLSWMCQCVFLEVTICCAFVFTLLAAEWFYSGMKQNVNEKLLWTRRHTWRLWVSLSSLLCFSLECETHCTKFCICWHINLSQCRSSSALQPM